MTSTTRRLPLPQVLTGMLVATYVRPSRAPAGDDAEQPDPRPSSKRAERMGAPAQPYLAALAIVLSGIAVVWRLRGQVACPKPRARTTVMA